MLNLLVAAQLRRHYRIQFSTDLFDTLAGYTAHNGGMSCYLLCCLCAHDTHTHVSSIHSLYWPHIWTSSCLFYSVTQTQQNCLPYRLTSQPSTLVCRYIHRRSFCCPRSSVNFADLCFLLLWSAQCRSSTYTWLIWHLLCSISCQLKLSSTTLVHCSTAQGIVHTHLL